jgi:hypothetical protein
MKDKPVYEISDYISGDRVEETFDLERARAFFKSGYHVVESRVKEIRWSKKVTITIVVSKT